MKKWQNVIFSRSKKNIRGETDLACHDKNCRLVSDIDKEDRIQKPMIHAERAGYYPCKICRPGFRPESK